MALREITDTVHLEADVKRHTVLKDEYVMSYKDGVLITSTSYRTGAGAQATLSTPEVNTVVVGTKSEIEAEILRLRLVDRNGDPAVVRDLNARAAATPR